MQNVLGLRLRFSPNGTAVDSHEREPVVRDETTAEAIRGLTSPARRVCSEGKLQTGFEFELHSKVLLGKENLPNSPTAHMVRKLSSSELQPHGTAGITLIFRRIQECPCRTVIDCDTGCIQCRVLCGATEGAE